jgi:hypothetical protein
VPSGCGQSVIVHGSLWMIARWNSPAAAGATS